MNLDALPVGEAVLDVHLFDIGGTPVTLSTLVVFLLVVGTAYGISRLLRRGLRQVFERRGVADPGTGAAIGRLIHYAIMGLGIAIGLNTAGVNLSALFAAGALFAVALGFAMQDLGANLAAGITLLIERTITPGDILEIDGQVVRVQRIGVRATIGTNLDDKDIIIPNSELVKNRVINYTLRDELLRVRVAVTIDPAADMRRVREVLEATARGVEWRSRKAEPVVLFTDFGPTGPVWEASVFIEDPWRVRSYGSQLREAMWWALEDAGIALARPQPLVVASPKPATTA